MQRGIVVPILGFTLVAWLGGCVADGEDGGILVLRNVLADATCKVTVSETETGLSGGSLDVLAPSGYLFIAQMRSRITALPGQEDQRTILVTGADIDIEFPNSTLFSEAELADLRAMNLIRYNSPFSALIRPGGLTDAGFELIPGDLSVRIAAKAAGVTGPFRLQALAKFTIKGTMSGGKITSQQFSYPITIGRGNVVNDAGTCPLPMGSMPRPGYACNPVQDGIVDCCRAFDGLRCPATVSTI